jgi:hypothetical protein
MLIGIALLLCTARLFVAGFWTAREVAAGCGVMAYVGIGGAKGVGLGVGSRVSRCRYLQQRCKLLLQWWQLATWMPNGGLGFVGGPAGPGGWWNWTCHCTWSWVLELHPCYVMKQVSDFSSPVHSFDLDLNCLKFVGQDHVIHGAYISGLDLDCTSWLDLHFRDVVLSVAHLVWSDGPNWVQVFSESSKIFSQFWINSWLESHWSWPCTVHWSMFFRCWIKVHLGKLGCKMFCSCLELGSPAGATYYRPATFSIIVKLVIGDDISIISANVKLNINNVFNLISMSSERFN